MQAWLILQWSTSRLGLPVVGPNTLKKILHVVTSGDLFMYTYIADINLNK